MTLEFPYESALARGAAFAVALKLLDDAFEVGIAGAEFAREPVAASRGDGLAVGEHVELTGLARSAHGLNAEAILDEGRETRDLGSVVVSGRAVNDFDFHVGLGLRSDTGSIQPPEP